jgi:hypothetical protein
MQTRINSTSYNHGRMQICIHFNWQLLMNYFNGRFYRNNCLFVEEKCEDGLPHYELALCISYT